MPPRKIRTLPSSEQRPLILYSDAEYTEGRPPRVGIVLFRDPPARPVGVTFELPIVLTDTWLARRQQIFPAEAVAIPIAMGMLARYICGRDVIAFCDNQAAVAALIRGAAKCADASGIAEVFTALQLQLSVRTWVDWVDSMSARRTASAGWASETHGREHRAGH